MKQTDEDIIAVVQGRIDKKNIQFRPHYSDNDFINRMQQTAAFDFVDYEYRVKPEPKVIYIVVYPDGYPSAANHATYEAAFKQAIEGDKITRFIQDMTEQL